MSAEQLQVDSSCFSHRMEVHPSSSSIPAEAPANSLSFSVQRFFKQELVLVSVLVSDVKETLYSEASSWVSSTFTAFIRGSVSRGDGSHGSLWEQIRVRIGLIAARLTAEAETC